MSSSLYSGVSGLAIGTGLYKGAAGLWGNSSGLIAGWGAFSPASLFLAGEQGFIYDPSDFTTLYQDNAGTTPITAVGQTVGLVLDKSRGLVLGAEKWSDSNVIIGTGWSQTGGVYTHTAGVDTFRKDVGLVAGKTYQITFTVSGRTAGNVGPVYGGSVNGPVVTADGTYTQRVASGVNAILYFQPSTDFVGSLSNISVRELPGNHATQSVLASRPILAREPLGGRRNLLTWTEQFDNAVWTKTNATVTANAAAAPDGTTTADTLIGAVSALAQRNCCVTQSATLVASANYTFSFSAAAAGTPHCVVSMDNGGGLMLSVAINLVTGTATAFNYAGVSALPADGINVGPLINGYRRIAITFANQGFNFFRIASSASTPTSTGGFWWNADGNGTSGIYIWGAQLETGSTATPYQRVTSVYDVTEAGKADLYYLLFDGSDDFLVTNTITPGTDKAQVFAGVRKLSDAVGTIIEHSAALVSNAGSFNLSNRDWTASTGAKWFWASRGSAAVPTAAEVAASGAATAILSGIGDITADTMALRVNGTQAASNASDQGTGNYLANPAYIGRRAGTTLPFNGRLYGLIARFGPNLSDVQIAQTEQWLNQKTGAF